MHISGSLNDLNPSIVIHFHHVTIRKHHKSPRPEKLQVERKEGIMYVCMSLEISRNYILGQIIDEVFPITFI